MTSEPDDASPLFLLTWTLKREVLYISASLIPVGKYQPGLVFTNWLLKFFKHLPQAGLFMRSRQTSKTQYLLCLSVISLLFFSAQGGTQFFTGALFGVCDIRVLALKQQVSAAVSPQRGTSCHITESYFLLRKKNINIYWNTQKPLNPTLPPNPQQAFLFQCQLSSHQ